MHPHLRAYGALAIGVTAISFSAILGRWANLPGVVAGFYRQAFGLLVLAPFIVYRLGRAASQGALAPRITTSRAAIWMALLAGLFFAADLGVWLTSLFYTTAANATLLANTSPLYVGLGAMFLFGEQLNAAFWTGLAVALGGAVLIVGTDASLSATASLGNLMALFAGFSFGLYLLAVSRARRALGATLASSLANLSGALALLAASVALGHSLAGFEPRQWWLLVAMGVGPQVIGYHSITYALGKLPAPFVSVTILGQPILTALLAIPLLGEGLSAIQVAGGLITLAGIYLVNRSRSVRRVAVEQAAS